MKLENIKIRQDLSEEEIAKYACKKNRINFNSVKQYKILKKSIDARNKDDVHYIYSIEIITLDEMDKQEKKETTIPKVTNIEEPVAIVGAGPAGLFCAITLIENGVKPIIVEQGKKVEERMKDVEEFIENGKLNPLSNVQFGEGGAGTFSDGKLTTNLHNPLCKKVIETFIKFGAPSEIGYINKPHIGTDNLVKILQNIRNYLLDNGAEILFQEKVKDLEIEEDKIKGIICESGKEIKANTVVLAIGHSARDMFETLHNKKISMQRKNFSVGLRIEQKQDMINKSQYGEKTKLKLPPAEYKLAYHGKERDCYTFCMCPGGSVIASSSEEGTIVTNGMSKFARDGENANSAILVNVTPNDFPGDSPLAGVYFQKELEEKAFKLGGENYFAPIQKVGDFLNDKKSTKIGKVKPTYLPGVTLSNLQEILPDFVTATLKEALVYFDRKIKGFADEDNILTGVETRSSSPVTILRNPETLMANVEGIYPCGEGAGYAGGITSAAVDGIKCAENILKRLTNEQQNNKI